MITIKDFPVLLTPEDDFEFHYDGIVQGTDDVPFSADFHARVNYPHVFHESKALYDHLDRASRNAYDGIEILPFE